MKFRVTAQPKAKKAEREPKSLAPSLLDDPAFSADPHSHPDFVTSHEPEWTTSPPVGHPPLKKTRRRRNLVTDENLTDTEFPLIQPPNTPAPPSSAPTDPPSLPVPPDVLRQVPALNNNHPPAASTAPSSLPTRAPPSVLSIDPDPAPQPPKHEKKGGLMTFLTRRKTTPSQAAPPAAAPRSKKLQAHRSLVPDLPNDVTRPPAPRQISEPIRPPTQERPVLLGRPATTGTATPMSVSTAASAAGSSASKRHASGVNSRLQDLDKIDELDETNPWGISLHHKGPYEAAVQAIKQNSRRGPLGLADNPNDYHLRAMHANGRPYVPPQAPIGVSLNLSPGQILPRNFHLQHNQHPRQRDKPEPQIRPLIVQQEVSSLKNAYQQPKPYAPTPAASVTSLLPHPPPQMRVEVYDDPARPAPVPEKPVDDDALNPFDIGMAMLQADLPDVPTPLPSPRVFVEPGLPAEQNEFDPYDPVHLEVHHSRTPSPAVVPRSKNGSPEASRESSRAPSRAPSPSHALRESLGSNFGVSQPEASEFHKGSTSSLLQAFPDPPPYSSPIHEFFPTQPIPPRQSPGHSRASSRNPSPPHSRHSNEMIRPVDADRSRPPSNATPPVNVHHMAPSQLPPMSSVPPAQMNREPVQVPPSMYTNDRDARSTHQSVSTGSSGQTRTGRPPPHRHLPKRLVMPAPLNNAAYGQIHNQMRSPPATASFLPPMTAYLPPEQARASFRPRPSAYPPPVMTAPRPPRPMPPPQPPIKAQEIPMAASRKLKKRASMINPPKPEPSAPPAVPTPPVVATVSFAPPIIGFDRSISREKILARSQTEKIPSKKLLSKRRV